MRSLIPDSLKRGFSLTEQKISSLREWVKIYGCGLCMGAADIVPGISGGTVALILGIYEPLIASINSIRWKLHQISWGFLSAIITGIVTSLILFAHTITYILNHEIYRACLYSAFLGLVLASSLIIGKKIKVWRWKYSIPFLAGAIIALFLTTVKVSPGSEMVYKIFIPKEQIPQYRDNIANYDAQNQLLLNVDEEVLAAMMARGTVQSNTFVTRQRDGKTGPAKQFANPQEHLGLNLKLIYCGAIAITAMLLPGISGSYLMVILGVYPIVIGAIADLTSGMRHFYFDIEAALTLTSMGIGIAIGGLLFARIVNWLFEHYHDLTISALLGFMLGALPSLWPFFAYEYVLLPLKLEKGPLLQTADPIFPSLLSGLFLISICFVFVGFTLAIGVDWAVRHSKRADASKSK